jgi:hypothetical protein
MFDYNTLQLRNKVITVNTVCYSIFLYWQVWRMSASLASLSKTGWQIWRVRHISEKSHFGEYSRKQKMANFWRVLALAKFTRE